MRTSDSPLALLAAAAEALDEEDLGALGDAPLASQIRALWVAMCRLQAQVSRRVAVFDERGAAARDGARSTRDWLRHRLRVDGVEAARQSTVAAALAGHPGTAAAYFRGEISIDHVAAIREAAWMLGDEAMSQGAEQLMLDHGRREPPGRLRRLARRLRERAEPRAALEALRRGREERWFEAVRTGTGSIALHGQLDASDGELLLTALTAESTGDAGLFRTPEQRHADALVAVLRIALRADLRHAGDRPRVVVTVPLRTLQAAVSAAGLAGGGPAASADPAAPGGVAPLTGGRERRPGARRAAGEPGPRYGPGEEALLGSGEPVPAETARRLACDARVLPAVLGGPSEPIEIGAEGETVSQGLRRALELRDRGCRFPGCDRSAGECEAHHVRHWAHGGLSTVDNVVLLCPHHHVLTHEGGWSVARDPYSGEVRARRPDGVRLDAVSPPPDPPG
jgi:hypothetical protein